MIKILFVCWGNICRSPMAEFVMKDLAEKAGLSDAFYIASAATSREEIGNGVYPPAARELAAHGISCEGHHARQLTKEDYAAFDLILGMEPMNLDYMLRILGGDPEKKLGLLPDYAGNPGGRIADPWYTGDFDSAWNDVFAGCTGLLEALTVDLRQCTTKKEIFDCFRARPGFEELYGSNADALADVLSCLPVSKREYALLPPEDPQLAEYTEKLKQVMEEAKAE